ncbi:MAG: hypothetical protein ABWK05_07760 [Pyrobaculum sp.]
MYENIERPLPKPSAEEYASARLLESLLALESPGRNLVRNAAGKVCREAKRPSEMDRGTRKGPRRG